MKKIILIAFLCAFVSNSLYAQWTASGTNIYFNNGGNVGIGNTDPYSKLSVYGVIQTDGFGFMSTLRGSGNNYTNLFLGGAIKDNNNGTFTVIGDGGSNYFSAIRMDNSGGNIGSINFYSGPSTGGANYTINNSSLSSYLRMTLVNGNLGIGIVNPQNKLDVNGTIHAKQVKIDLNGWSDYVFRKDYQLPSLQEVKAYIEQNQHLPGIPSEKEIITKGLDVGAMNQLLMKKVEELTLYLIEKERVITEQQQKLSEQELINKTSEKRIEKIEALLLSLKIK